MQFSIPVHPPPDDLIEEAFRRADWNRALFVKSDGKPAVASDGYFVFIPEEEWSDIDSLQPPRPPTKWDPPNPYLPENLVEYLNALPSKPRFHVFSRTEATTFWLFASLYRTRWHDLASSVELEENGAPQRNAEQFGLLTYSPNARLYWADRIVPYTCGADRVIRPNPSRTGVRFKRSVQCVPGENYEFSEIDGVQIKLPYWYSMIFDPYARELILLEEPRYWVLPMPSLTDYALLTLVAHSERRP